MSSQQANLDDTQQTTLWIYLYRCSKLGPRSIWYKQSCCKLEEQTRTVCDKVIRHCMERVDIDHSPIKSANLREHPSQDSLNCLFSIMDLLVASNPELYIDVAYKLNISTNDERAVCRAYSDFAESLFQKGITWPLITSLLTFSGSLAAECTKNGRSILVRSICDWATVFTVMKLKEWLISQGGWDGILDYFGDFKIVAKRKASMMIQSGREKICKASSIFIYADEVKNNILIEKIDIVKLKDVLIENKIKLSAAVILAFSLAIFKPFIWMLLGTISRTK